MMVSAVTIDGLDKMEQKEHFFNDVKYATISLNKDRKLISEQFEPGIYQLDLAAVKRRLQEEYNELAKPTYGFLRLEGFPLSSNEVNTYLTGTEEIYQRCQGILSRITVIEEQLASYGLIQTWNYQKLTELTLIFDSIDPLVIPTRYWFDLNKYDFIQELMNETQTKVEEYLTAAKRLHQSWSEKVLEAESVAALDYYIERRDAGLKLFDLNFHKSKKVLKELFIDEYRTFQDSEIEELHKNVYVIKRNEYWLSRYLSRIKQFLGETYQETATDFTVLRTQYAIISKLGAEFTRGDSTKQFTTSMIEEVSYQKLTVLVTQLKECLNELPYESLLEILPCEKETAMEQDVHTVSLTVQSFFETMNSLKSDYELFLQFRHAECAQQNFELDDMRKVLYCLERVVQKSDWLKKHQAKIKELFRNEEPTMETDWNTLKDKLFHTDVKDSFTLYETVDKESFLEANGEQPKLVDAVRYILYLECPLKEEILYKRIVSVMELVRMTPKMKQEIAELLETELSEEFYRKDDYIYSTSEDPIKMRIPAKEEEKREIACIAPLELKAGILTLLEVNFEMTMDAIGKEISVLLGYPRRTKKFNDILEQAVREMQREDIIRRYSGGFRIQSY